MENWENMRLRRRAGVPIKVIAREYDVSPNSVRKCLRNGAPPKRIELPRTSKLDLYQKHIDDLLHTTPKITAVRIGSYLRKNVDTELIIAESALRKYVARRRSFIRPKESFIRAHYGPGDQAQLDFSPMTVCLAGVLTKVELFVVRLSYSGRTFARTSTRCDRPSLFAGLLAAFSAFGGLPRTALFDNASTAVLRVLRGPKRLENNEFRAFRGALTLNMEFAAPAKGNEKGGVEGIHGFIEDNFFRPIPEFANIEELNVALAAFCQADLARTAAGQQESIGERFAREAPTLYPLPRILPRACVTHYARVNKFSEVCFERNWYSVPTKYAHTHANVEVYENNIRIIVGDVVAAEHQRSSGIGQHLLDPRHYLDLLQYKHRAAASALALSDGRISDTLRALFDRYQKDQDNPISASKRWMKVVALLSKSSSDELDQAITRALARGTDDPAAIALILRQSNDPPERRTLNPHALPIAARMLAPVVDLTAYATVKLMEGVA